MNERTIEIIREMMKPENMIRNSIKWLGERNIAVSPTKQIHIGTFVPIKKGNTMLERQCSGLNQLGQLSRNLAYLQEMGYKIID